VSAYSRSPAASRSPGPLLAGLALTVGGGLPDLEVPAVKRGQDADSGFLRVRGCEAGHQATVFSHDVLNPVQRQQASRSCSVTCDGDKVVGHAMGTLLGKPGGFEGLGMAAEIADPDDLAAVIADQLCEFTGEVQPGRLSRGLHFSHGEHGFPEVMDVVKSDCDS
jgi:hypothetical protein